MHLTPRSLGLAAAAAFTGCTLFGILTGIDLVPAATAGTPSTAEATSDATLAASSPHATATTAPRLPDATPATSTAPTPTPTASSTSASAAPPPAPRTPTVTATVTATEEPAAASTASRATARPTPRPRPRAITARTTPTRGWAPPSLRVGANTITVPRLTSGAKVSVTVGCSPSAGCALTGPTLTIAEGTSVTVTWAAPARAGHTAWSVSRGL